ncbi:MAG: hypothetical protein ABSA93_09375 [Streptosporangiaceae bacterium]
MKASADVYEEVHSAVSPSFLLLYLGLPAAALTGLILLTALSPYGAAISARAGLAAVAVLICTSLVTRCWPTGILLDETGITIGAIRFLGGARKRTPSVYRQARGVYTCPWDSVYDVRIVTDQAELRTLARSPAYYTFTNRWFIPAAMKHCNIGVLSSPLMGAALVFEIHPSSIIVTAVRPGRSCANGKNGYFTRKIPPLTSPTWIVPTRHPEALEVALKRFR